MAGHLERYGWDNSFFPRLAYIPSSEPNAGDGPYTITKTGGVYTWSPESALTPHRTLVWQWNGVDVSQFEASPSFIGHAGGTSDLTSPTLSVVADANLPGGQKLRFAVTQPGGAGYRVCHWLVKASESTLSWGSGGTYEWEIVCAPTFPPYGGITFFADPVTNHYYSWGWFSANGTRHRVDAGTVINFMGGATNNNLLSGTSVHDVRMRLWGDHVVGGKPRFVARGEGVGFGNHFERCLREPSGQWQTTGTTPPASWQNKTTSRWGLSRVGQGATGVTNMDIVSLKLFKLGTGL